MRIYTPENRTWFTKGDVIAGVVVINIRREVPVGKITATLKCVEHNKVSRIKVKERLGTTGTREVRVDNVERYVGDPVLVADIRNRTPASRKHEFYFHVSMPHEIKVMPPSFDNWELSFGRWDWYGVNWLVEVEFGGQNTKRLEPVSQKLQVFPLGTELVNNVYSKKSVQGSLALQLAPPANRRGVRRILNVAEYGNAVVKLNLSAPKFAQVGKSLNVTLGIESGLSDALLLERVSVRFCSAAKASSADWRGRNEYDVILAEWEPYAILPQGLLDLTPEFHRNLQTPTLWSCDFSTDTLSVTHFIRCNVRISGKWSRQAHRVLSIRQKLTVAPPFLAVGQKPEKQPEYLPNYEQAIEGQP